MLLSTSSFPSGTLSVRSLAVSVGSLGCTALALLVMPEMLASPFPVILCPASSSPLTESSSMLFVQQICCSHDGQHLHAGPWQSSMLAHHCALLLLLQRKLQVLQLAKALKRATVGHFRAGGAAQSQELLV